MTEKMPTQSYPLAYFKRHVRSMFQDPKRIQGGCVVLDADHKPFLIVAPRPPAVKTWHVVVSLTHFIEKFDDVVEEHLAGPGQWSTGIGITYHDVMRFVVRLHPDWKKPAEKPHANDDAVDFSPIAPEQLLDAAQMMRRAADHFENAASHFRRGQGLDAARAALGGKRTAENAVRLVTSLNVTAPAEKENEDV